MNNLFKTFIYFILSIQEKVLHIGLKNKFKIDKQNSNKRKYIKNGCVLNLESEAKKKKEQAQSEIQHLLKTYQNDPQKLLEFIENNKTPIIINNKAVSILSFIKEAEGLILPCSGIKALYLNLILNKKFSLKTNLMFIISNRNVEIHYMLHDFYKWYMIKFNVVKLTRKGNELMEKMLSSDEIINKLSYQEIYDIKTAIELDKEAIDFVVTMAKNQEGSKKALEKLSSDGSATI